MTILEVLQSTGIPSAYSHFRTKQEPPYLVYIGAGQDTDAADNTYPWRRNRYQVEYYFTKKSQTNEAAIEAKLLAYGYNYTKSEDVYIEDENVFVIYYTI